MDGKESLLHFNVVDQKPIVVFCKDLFDNQHDADVIFISKQKQIVKAHKVILSLSSTFFKTLFEGSSSDLHATIIAPNYSTQALSVFVQFFYNGEIKLQIGDLMDEFASLCQEFNCEEIPVISDLIKTHKESAMLSTKDEWNGDKNSSNLSITRIVEAPKVEIEFDEYFESNDNVETIFFNENEAEFLDRTPDDGSHKKESTQSEEVREIKEEYLNVQYIEENPGYEMQANKPIEEFEIVDEKHEDTPEQLENLESAVDDIKKGMSFNNAHKKYGITRGAIFRHLQGTSEQQQSSKKVKKNPLKPSTPSISFPAVAMNLSQLREEQNRFKKRLQEAINSCRDSGNSTKKASKMFGVSVEALERNLRFRQKKNS